MFQRLIIWTSFVVVLLVVFAFVTPASAQEKFSVSVGSEKLTVSNIVGENFKNDYAGDALIVNAKVRVRPEGNGSLFVIGSVLTTRFGDTIMTTGTQMSSSMTTDGTDRHTGGFDQFNIGLLFEYKGASVGAGVQQTRFEKYFTYHLVDPWYGIDQFQKDGNKLSFFGPKVFAELDRRVVGSLAIVADVAYSPWEATNFTTYTYVNGVKAYEPFTTRTKSWRIAYSAGVRYEIWKGLSAYGAWSDDTTRLKSLNEGDDPVKVRTSGFRYGVSYTRRLSK